MSQSGKLNGGSPPPPVTELYIEGDVGGPVGPDSNDTIHLIGGDNVTVTGDPGTNTLTIDVQGVEKWTEITGSSASMAVNNGYIANNAGGVTLTLPATSALGSVIKVAGKGSGGWVIAQNASQVINWNASLSTTSGTSGFITSLDRYDTIELLCITANTTWVVLWAKGNMLVN